MSKEKLPTFRRLGRTLLEHKRGIAIAFCIVIGYTILSMSLERYVSIIQPCDQPCQDAESCDPLDFTFEIAPAQIKIGRPSFIWYRARLKNRSCRRLEGITVTGFLDSQDLDKGTGSLRVTVTDPKGVEVERRPLPGPDGGISWDYGSSKGVSISTKGTIYPYQPDFKRIDALSSSQGIKGRAIIGLAPGDSFETFAPILRPYRIVATSIQEEDGGIGHGYRWVPVENPPSFPIPPEGFTLFDRYVFDRPGRYTIRATFVDEIYVYPIYSRWNTLPSWLKLFFRGAQPVSWISKMREVNLVAPPAVIEATR